MPKIKNIFNKLILTLLLAAAFNLSFHVNEIEPIVKYSDSSVYLDKQEITLLPFGQQESTPPFTPYNSVITLTFIALVNPCVPLIKSFIREELFYKQNIRSFKEYPFIVLVRKLRI